MNDNQFIPDLTTAQQLHDSGHIDTPTLASIVDYHAAQAPAPANYVEVPQVAPAPTVGGYEVRDGNGASAVNNVVPLAPASTAGNKLEVDSGTDVKSLGSDAQKSIVDMHIASNKASTAQAEADKAAADRDAAQSHEEVALQTERQREHDKWQATRDLEIQRQQDAIQQVNDKYNSMSVDSGRLFGDGQTSNKIWAAIGLSLGALSQGLTGKDAGVVAILQKHIANDIEAQRANIAKTGDQVKQMRGGLQDYMQITKDMDAAKDLEMARQLKLIGTKYKEIGARSSDPQIKANVLKNEAEIASKVAGLQASTNIVTTHYADKKIEQAQKLEGFSDGTKDKVVSAKMSLNALDRLEGLAQTVGTGRTEDWKRGMSRWFGIADGDEAAFQAEMSGLQSRLVHELSGATASNEERAEIAKQMMKPTDNPEAFARLIREVRNRTIDSTQELRKATIANKQNDPAPDFDQRVARYNVVYKPQGK